MRKELRASLAFPAKLDEAFNVHDGAGRIVERWRATKVMEFKTEKLITYDIDVLVPEDRS